MTTRIRFAPSPTGNLHLGTTRTALFNWLYARQQNGVFVLRIEDTDLQRSKPEYEANIIEGLKWLGLDWDEGPDVGGDYGPYRQTERTEAGIYQKHVETLLEKGLAYYCFETPEELEAEREEAAKKGIPYVYSRKALSLSPEEVKANLEAGKNYTIRFKIPDDTTITIQDMIRGEIDFEMKLISDFVIMKSDGSPAYNFAVVVDDLEMAISHVIRGEDHISNTPKQIAIFEALGAPVPKFAHMPMILGPDKAKLSKRHGATSVSDYRDQGFLSEAMFNYLPLLGWTPPDEKEILPREETIKLFDIESLSKSGAVFDIQKLTWMNGMYIRECSVEALKSLTDPFISQEIKSNLDKTFSDDQLNSIYNLIKSNITTLTEIDQECEIFLRDDATVTAKLKEVPFTPEQQQGLALIKSKIESAEQFDNDTLKTILEEVLSETGLGKGHVFRPFRLAVSGEKSGHDLLTFVTVLGKDVVLRRLSNLG